MKFYLSLRKCVREEPTLSLKVNQVTCATQIAAVWVFLGLCFGCVAIVCAEPNGTKSHNPSTPQLLTALDSDFQDASSEYYQNYSKTHNVRVYRDPKVLHSAVFLNKDPIEAVALIRANIKLVVHKTPIELFSDFLGFVYDANATATVKIITQQVNKSNDFEKISQNYFLLAKYYYERGNWRGVRGALSKVDIKSLSVGDSQYHNLLMGFALQESKEHRKSVAYYKTIPKSSPYYTHAKLNEGTAYLRQGWWTEANIEFERALSVLNVLKLKTDEEKSFEDRLLVVLGFSQLYYEFYRDARKTLRRVSVDGVYTNKAMMGLGIAAAHQKDFSGALNIFELLIQKDLKDVNVDEAYLLIPFGYEELEDATNATITYQQAINYYQSRLFELQAQKSRLNGSSSRQFSTVIENLNNESKVIYGKKNVIPNYVMNNYRTIVKMDLKEVNIATTKSIQAVKAQYEQKLKLLVLMNIDLRRSILSSYLSQAKFGIAKLYDK